MLLNPEETNDVLLNFPSIELSYEKMAHKKVYNSNIILAIPEGEKHFAWFTKYYNKPVCFLMKINNKKITEISKCNVKYNYDLSYGNGTIIYGTIFNYESHSCFCIEDLCFYGNKNVYFTRFDEKINVLQSMLTHKIYQNNVNANKEANRSLLFGLPIMENNFYTLLKNIQQLPYSIKNLQFRFFQPNTDIFNMKYFKPNANKVINNTNHLNKEINRKIFKVTPDVQNDIYHLYKEENGKDVYVDVAFIPNFDSSKQMNKLFRNIKENENLDALEESDDEDEFQSEREDKFVYLERSFKMVCSFHHKFGKWVPLKVVN